MILKQKKKVLSLTKTRIILLQCFEQTKCEYDMILICVLHNKKRHTKEDNEVFCIQTKNHTQLLVFFEI